MDAPFALPRLCLVREVPASFDRCLRSDPAPIDVTEARRQHAAYVEALRAAGCAVTILPADESCPDCCFVEDAAVVLGSHALATCIGAPSRRAESGPVAAALATQGLTTYLMSAPATLDGGDVLRAGGVLFVGLSGRTNAAGVARLTEAARLDGLEVRTVPVAAGLHLKSACSLAAPDLLVHLAGLDPGPFRAAGLRCLAVAEPAGANALRLGDVLLVSAAAPRTAELLAREGIAVRAVAVGEFHKGDGALTCLSIRLPADDAWAT